jgi:hypothetical protein
MLAIPSSPDAQVLSHTSFVADLIRRVNEAVTSTASKDPG